MNLRGLAANLLDVACALTAHMGWTPWAEWWHVHVCSGWVWSLSIDADD